MIVLDTDVLSEMLQPAPDEGVVTWLLNLPHQHRRITVVTAAELLQGVSRTAQARRRDQLHGAVEGILETFHGRILEADLRSAPYFADIRATRRRLGRPIGSMDAWIAAICRRHDVPLATRNVKDFDGTGIAVVNPWEPA
ncbi:plasmid stability protein StbB [Knoellia sinensis KCTC 19936]|uniref:Ribonuclease VapC n=1 Tax=Knoellia sinensis KCTC 19936 TaxID=1385520 RepID=A0A0A0JA95_9MICO|nr:type II toxin-antitoxin system VapC family toxin [Knoellia sinensis]KGN32491.1 plasmid stability protein StbB [Knoellia sinensis KCTC 19936]